MPASFWVPVLVWSLINAVAVPATWELVWPRYKRYGKVCVSLGVTVFLARVVGWWSLLFVALHPLLGLVFHVSWCRKHDMPVWKPDPAAYRQAQRQWAEGLRGTRRGPEHSGAGSGRDPESGPGSRVERQG